MEDLVWAKLRVEMGNKFTQIARKDYSNRLHGILSASVSKVSFASHHSYPFAKLQCIFPVRHHSVLSLICLSICTAMGLEGTEINQFLCFRVWKIVMLFSVTVANNQILFSNLHCSCKSWHPNVTAIQTWYLLWFVFVLFLLILCQLWYTIP